MHHELDKNDIDDLSTTIGATYKDNMDLALKNLSVLLMNKMHLKTAKELIVYEYEMKFRRVE